MYNDRFTAFLGPVLVLCAILTVLFVSVHAASIGFDDLQIEIYAALADFDLG